MNLGTRIACRTLGAAGIALACIDSAKVAKQFSEIGSEHAEEHFMERVYFSTRTTDKVSPASNTLREKAFEVRSKNPIPSLIGKIKGCTQGFMYGMSNYLPVITCSALAILGKNIVAKAGAISLGVLAVLKVLRDGFGVGKNNPMS